MHKFVGLALPLVFLMGVTAVALANPDPFARDLLCSGLSICFRTQNAAFWNNVIYEIGLGSAVSVAFYWLLVKVPEFEKRRRLREYLLSSYKSFRRDVTFQFLFASGYGSVDPDFVEELLPQKAFRKHFKQPSTKVYGDRWHDVANGLQSQHRRDLFVVMSILRDDVVYVLNNTDVADQRSFEFLHRLTKAIASHDPRYDDYDDDKALLRLFWSLMAGWNLVTGYEEEDQIQRIIRRI
ncbi:hypothetical protein [Neorhizobium alkalisoli]|uniref:hypothetical protein n=1 Tax=Neorhizobium alkalisoli TaxID=528178 RepID=UPI000CF9B408|nr:hypothetical protein [Neorhizobium alkalisoli]